jgi:hypothetical protein
MEALSNHPVISPRCSLSASRTAAHLAQAARNASLVVNAARNAAVARIVLPART